jgi:hypothetical protein
MTGGAFLISMSLWFVVSSAIAFSCQRPVFVYCSTSILALVPIMISQHQYGFLPMAGIFHVVCMGLYPVALNYAFTYYKRKHGKSK